MGYGKIVSYIIFYSIHLKKLLIGILFVLLFPIPSFAKEQVTLFWGVTCPYCHTVKEKISEEKLDEKIDIVEIELQENKENLPKFEEKIKECNINPQQAGIPMLFVDGKCYQGVDPIMEKLNGMVEGKDVNGSIEEIDLVEGKRNTEIMIGIVFLFLVVIVLFGYYRQNMKTSKKRDVKKSKKLYTLILLLLAPLFFASKTYAICPLCTIAVGAGVGFSRSLGIDDVIVGLWVGGLLVSSSMWLFEWLKSKKIAKKHTETYWAFGAATLMFALTLIPLKMTGIIGHPFNKILGIDKVLLGVIIGSVVFFASGRLHFYLKRKNKDQVYFPYQKVVMPVGALWLTTILLYLIVYY